MLYFLREERGFTWIEWVILVAVIGIASALAVPRIQQICESMLEASTKANIEALRSAIAIYYGDHEGIWPTTLDVNDKTPDYGFGVYLDKIPPVGATHLSDPSKGPAGNQITYKTFTDEPSLAAHNSYGAGWRYDGPKQGNTGRIWVNNSYTDSNGVSYTTYGYPTGGLPAAGW